MAFLLFRAAATTCGFVVFEREATRLDPRDASRAGRRLCSLEYYRVSDLCSIWPRFSHVSYASTNRWTMKIVKYFTKSLIEGKKRGFDFQF